jgi:hypothetical protein
MNLHQRKVALIHKAKKRFPCIVRLPKEREFLMINDSLAFWYNDINGSTHVEIEEELWKK